MATCRIDLRQLVIDEANDQGVPPEIALAVATRESNICHWYPNGQVKRGSSGEYGIFQLRPATAAALGVDPTDVNDNIHGGVKYLKQLFNKYGTWALAVQRYNGSGPRAQAYSAAVMAIADRYGAAMQASRANDLPAGQAGASGFAPGSSNNLVAGAVVIVGAGILAYAIAS